MTPRVRRPPAPLPGCGSVTELHPHGFSPRDPELVPLATVQGTLALDLGIGLEEPAPPAPEAPMATGLRAAELASSEEEVRVWATRFSQAVVEVLGGLRPLTQLLRWTDLAVYDDLDRRVKLLARTRATATRHRSVRPQVRSVHVCRPTPWSAEVSVHVGHGRRSRALAARLEHRDGRWRCTALQLG